MTVVSSTDGFQDIHERYKHYFQKNAHPSFMNLLWQFIVNGARKNQVVVFHPVYSEFPEDRRWEIGIVTANESGFNRTGVGFDMCITDYNEACEICDALNDALFGITDTVGNAIVDSSMKVS